MGNLTTQTFIFNQLLEQMLVYYTEGGYELPDKH